MSAKWFPKEKKKQLLLLIKVCGNWIFDGSGHRTTRRCSPRHAHKQMYQKIFAVVTINGKSGQLVIQTDKRFAAGKEKN